MNILIVDDIQDNRDALNRLIIQYTRKYNNPSQIYEAENGEIAIQMCNENEIDLIFMDITMPVMNGLEATKIIKQKYPSSMIIVVSSESDESIKKEILSNGAEDYIMKPFSSSIMLSRLNNYAKLINSRNSINYQPKAINNFTSSIYCYQMKFFISSEDELAQLWETLLIRLDFNRHIEHLNDFMRLLYNVVNLHISKSYQCEIIIEEDEGHFYFTINNIHLLNLELLENMLAKCSIAIYHEIKDKFLSFAVQRKIQNTQIHDETAMIIEEKPLHVEAPIAPSINAVVPKEEVLQTYELLDEDDLEELGFLIDKLHSEIAMMGTSSLEIDDIDTINTYVQKMSTILSASNDTYNIATSLDDFCALLGQYSHEFLAESKNLANMMQSFINDITMWRDMIFFSGAPSVNFLDHSISSNVEMIRAVFIQNDASDEDLDDIFDF